MDLGLTDKIAIVTGSSRGLGLASARALVAEGCRVCLCARGEERLAEAAVEVEASARRPGMVLTVQADVSTAAGVELVMARTVERFGGVDILVNNVGKAGGTDILGTTDAEWQSAFDETLFPAIRASRLAVPLMRQRGGGVIILIASIWGRESGGRMTYNAVKAAEISLGKALAQQLAPMNIRVNSVAPGLDPVPRRILAQAPAGRSRRHRGVRAPRAAVRPVRPRRRSRRRGRVSRLVEGELGQRRLRHRRRLPVAVEYLNASREPSDDSVDPEMLTCMPDAIGPYTHRPRDRSRRHGRRLRRLGRPAGAAGRDQDDPARLGAADARALPPRSARRGGRQPSATSASCSTSASTTGSRSSAWSCSTASRSPTGCPSGPHARARSGDDRSWRSCRRSRRCTAAASCIAISKPTNIFLTANGVKLLDFGLARSVAAMALDETSVTMPGIVMGSPRYMAPEQVRGEDVDRARRHLRRRPRAVRDVERQGRVRRHLGGRRAARRGARPSAGADGIAGRGRYRPDHPAGRGEGARGSLPERRRHGHRRPRRAVARRRGGDGAGACDQAAGRAAVQGAAGRIRKWISWRSACPTPSPCRSRASTR